MLANAIFSATLLAFVALSFLSAGFAMTRAGIHRLAETYVASGYQTGTRSLQRVLAADMQGGGLPSPMPAISALPLACADPSCRYFTGESIAYTSTTFSPSPGATCDPSQSNCAQNEQANSYVAEDRIAARVTVTVADAQKNPIVTRSGDVTFRLLRVAPYAVVASFRDGSFDGLATDGATGDDGGVAPATPNPCASGAAGSSDDTAIRVAYRNVQSNACSDGSAWRTASYSQGSSAPAGWSP